MGKIWGTGLVDASRTSVIQGTGARKLQRCLLTILSYPSGLELAQEIAIFGALDAWIGAWNWQKWPQAILSHQLGCDMAHQALSRWTGLAWSHPGPFGPDLAKK